MDKEKIYIETNAVDGHTHIKLTAMYDKGEYRYPRGYYLVVTAVAMEPMPYGGQMEAWSSDSPYQRYLIEKVERKNPKRYQEFLDKVNKNAQAIASAFEKRDYNAVWQYV